MVDIVVSLSLWSARNLCAVRHYSVTFTLSAPATHRLRWDTNRRHPHGDAVCSSEYLLTRATVFGLNSGERLLDVLSATGPRGLAAVVTTNLLAHGWVLSVWLGWSLACGTAFEGGSSKTPRQASTIEVDSVESVGAKNLCGGVSALSDFTVNDDFPVSR